MKKIAVIGASGMVASRFVEMVQGKFDITPLDEKTLDITDREQVLSYFGDNKFGAVVNFAAFTNVDAAEKERGNEKGIAWRVNVDGPKNLTEAALKFGLHHIHISTDFVFRGDKQSPGPYEIDSKIPENPDGIGWYGWTKNRAEYELERIGGQYSIVRYGYPFRAVKYSLKSDWARNLINLYNDHKMYPLFTDQIQSVLFVDDLVVPLTKIVEDGLTGVSHICANETNTPYEIGKYLLEKYSGGEVDLQKGSMEEFLRVEGRTPRPMLGGLKVEKTQEILGMKFRSWKEMVDDFVNQLWTSI